VHVAQVVADGRRCLRFPDGTPVEVRLSEDPEAPACLLRTLAFALPALPCLAAGAAVARPRQARARACRCAAARRRR